MKFTLGAIAAVGATLLNVVAAADLDPIVIKGNSASDPRSFRSVPWLIAVKL